MKKAVVLVACMFLMGCASINCKRDTYRPPVDNMFDCTIELMEGEVGRCAGVVVLTTDGPRVLTAAHCAKNITNSTTIKHARGEQEIGTSWRSDQSKDLALIRFRHDTVVQACNLARHMPRVGETVYSIGTSGPEGLSMDSGMLSTHVFPENVYGQPLAAYTIDGWYGDSGGPIFNRAGEIIGIASMKSRPGTELYAVTLNDIRSFLDE